MRSTANIREGAGIGRFSLALATAQADTGNPREQWIHLLPAGTFTARDGRGPWSVPNLAAVIDASRRFAGTRLIPVDYEHQTDLSAKNGQPAPAAGWIKGLQARTDGIWGLVEWTDQALAHLNAKAYRYLSPVFNHTPHGEVTRILRAALTNNPALDQLTALARAGDIMPNDQTSTPLRELLGLDSTADLATILDKVRELLTARQSAAPDPAQYVPIGDFQTVVAELQTVKHSVSEEAAEQTVARAIESGFLPPSMRDWGLSLCRIDKTAFDGFIKGIAPLFAAIRHTQTGGLPPEARGARQHQVLDDEQHAICRALGHTPEDLTTYGAR